MSNYGNQSQSIMQNPNTLTTAAGQVAQKPSNEQRSMTPIEERAQQLEKELVMLTEAVSVLASRIDKVLCPVPDQDGKLGGIGQPSPPQSAMTRALDYAINSIAIQRIELIKMAERVEL